MKKLFFFCLFSLALSSCNDGMVDRIFHSNETVTLPKGKKLVSVSWKNGELYYLLRDMEPTDKSETYTLVQAEDFDTNDNQIFIIEVE